MPLVVDANVLVALAVPLPYSAAAGARMDGWIEVGEILVSPALWEYEATSAIRKYAVQRDVEAAEIQQALLRLDSLPVESIPNDPDLRRAALIWAARLGHHAAYDSFYVALAERLGTELWSADLRLVNGCAAQGTHFVKPISQSPS
jgi:predicted nucleic acid-binding protein